MEMKIDIPFNQLRSVVAQLTPSQKQRLRKELDAVTSSSKNGSLKALLLQGPMFSEEQVQMVEDTRKSINKWRTK